MNAPKHAIGDWVEVEFSADIEGEVVTVRKRLVVTAVMLVDMAQTTGVYHYKLTEQLNGSRWIGRRYEKVHENRLHKIEPLVNEILKANADSTT